MMMMMMMMLLMMMILLYVCFMLQGSPGHWPHEVLERVARVLLL